MDLEPAILDALHDDPDDATSWLVLADWLEEQGQPERAEFMRLHRRLRGLTEEAERVPLEERLCAMLTAGVRPCVPRRVNSFGMELVLLPPGVFWLGSPEGEDGRYSDEGPRLLVEIRRPFYLGAHAVTQEEYERVMGFNPSHFAPGGELADIVRGRDVRRHPVENVTWHDATAFCRTLSDLPAEQQAGRVYRLPTEVEWEYACRGGAALCLPFPCGRTITPRLACYRDSARQRSSARRRHTMPVGSYPPNGFGLHDMVGNTWEWCADWYSSTAYASNPSADPPGPAEGERRNARGGTYNLETRRVRSADRSSFEPELHDSDLGFRVLCEWRPPGRAFPLDIGVSSATVG